MGRMKKGSWLLAVLLLLPAGCFNLKQPRNTIDYYTLEYDPPGISGGDPVPAVIRVERLTVAPPYNTRRMIYQDRSFVRNGYVYHQWRANPGDLATYFLARDMKETGLFAAVLPFESRIPASYVLEGSVDEFYEKDLDEAWKAVLSIGITLMAENEPDMSRKILFQKTYHAEQSCNKKNPQALAEAMSEAMRNVSGKTVQEVYDHLKKHR
jgi:ABC-type uncharacterized transport system auxiliary subunit